MCGQQLPAGLRQADELPEPIFTPSTKAPTGEHDQNIASLRRRRCSARTSPCGCAIWPSNVSIRRGLRGAERGIIIADTKFEFGIVDGELILIDEVLTPDSSRFWPRSEYRPGTSAAELRQAVRARLA